VAGTLFQVPRNVSYQRSVSHLVWSIGGNHAGLDRVIMKHSTQSNELVCLISKDLAHNVHEMKVEGQCIGGKQGWLEIWSERTGVVRHEHVNGG
jgi:hypothetical protein